MKARRLPDPIAPSWGFLCRTEDHDNYVLGASPMAMDVFKAWVQGAAVLYPLKAVEHFVAPSLYRIEFSQFNEVAPFYAAECVFHHSSVAHLLAALLCFEGKPFLMRVYWNGLYERETIIDARSYAKGPAAYLRSACSQGRSELLQVYENSVVRAA